MLIIERDGGISGYSDPLLISFSFFAMALLLKNVRAITTSTAYTQADPQATIQQHWSDGTSDKRLARKAISLSTIDQITSFIVPLGLTSTNVAHIVDIVHFM
jgi:hypothetical protein